MRFRAVYPFNEAVLLVPIPPVGRAARRGLAVGSVLVLVAAAGRGFGAIHFQELWDFHIYSNKAFSIQHSAFSQGHCIGDFFWQRAKRHLGTMMT